VLAIALESALPEMPAVGEETVQPIAPLTPEPPAAHQ
jgi:hypothetical protein